MDKKKQSSWEKPSDLLLAELGFFTCLPREAQTHSGEKLSV